MAGALKVTVPASVIATVIVGMNVLRRCQSRFAQMGLIGGIVSRITDMNKHPLSNHKHDVSYAACGDCLDSFKEALTLAVRTAELLMEEKELAAYKSEMLGPLMKRLRLDLII